MNKLIKRLTKITIIANLLNKKVIIKNRKKIQALIDFANNRKEVTNEVI